MPNKLMAYVNSRLSGDGAESPRPDLRRRTIRSTMEPPVIIADAVRQQIQSRPWSLFEVSLTENRATLIGTFHTQREALDRDWVRDGFHLCFRYGKFIGGRCSVAAGNDLWRRAQELAVRSVA